MVAKTFQGLEEVLAEELRGIGAINVEPGRRAVAFTGDLETLYKANICCRTALRILKPFYSYRADNPDELYEKAKEYDWMQLLSLDKTFSVDTTSHSEEFTHSKYATYRIKDAIVDRFRDRFGEDKRPGVRLNDADVVINVHISGKEVTLSLDSSGESLSRRGYMVERTEAPINEVLAAGIIMLSGYRGDAPFVDPMCGSGTFLIEAALIAANINPGLFRKGFAFEKWKDFDPELFDRIYNDDSEERTPSYPIIGADISPKAIVISNANIKNAGVAKYISTSVKALASWEEAPLDGILCTNPPYGERIGAPDMDALYAMIGNRLKKVFKGYHAWIIGYREEYFHKIGLAPSQKITLNNGGLDCELREYVIFEGDKRSFRAAGGDIKSRKNDAESRDGEKRDKKNLLKEKYERGTRENREPKFEKSYRGRSDAPDPNFKPRYEKVRKFRKDRDDEGEGFKRDRKPFGSDRKPFGPDRKSFGPDRKSFDKPRTFSERDDLLNKAMQIEGSEDNPLRMRRNPMALKGLQDRKPRIGVEPSKSEANSKSETSKPTSPSAVRGWKRRDNGEKSKN